MRDLIEDALGRRLRLLGSLAAASSELLVRRRLLDETEELDPVSSDSGIGVSCSCALIVGLRLRRKLLSEERNERERVIEEGEEVPLAGESDGTPGLLFMMYVAIENEFRFMRLL